MFSGLLEEGELNKKYIKSYKTNAANFFSILYCCEIFSKALVPLLVRPILSLAVSMLAALYVLVCLSQYNRIGIKVEKSLLFAHKNSIQLFIVVFLSLAFVGGRKKATKVKAASLSFSFIASCLNYLSQLSK